jgi:protein-S-isoprenylcysteine O-methyltransferase Ste14
MYVAFVVAIIGQALLLSRPVLLIYAAALLIALVAFVRWHEERTRSKRSDPGLFPRPPCAGP